jgi:hypothetical protein
MVSSTNGRFSRDDSGDPSKSAAAECISFACRPLLGWLSARSAVALPPSLRANGCEAIA